MVKCVPILASVDWSLATRAVLLEGYTVLLLPDSQGGQPSLRHEQLHRYPSCQPRSCYPSKNPHGTANDQIHGIMIIPASLTRSSARTSLLDNLPPELVIYITDFLPPSSTACLSLTCKTFYSLIRQRCNTEFHTYQERFSFLNCLARDLPEYIPCHGRVNPKLYQWRHQRNEFHHCDHCLQNVNHRVKYNRTEHYAVDTSGIPMYTVCGGTYHRVMSTDCMTFGLRTLVLRHELLGPEYGVPISELECAFTRRTNQKDRPICKIKTIPRVVQGGNLIIQKIVNYRSPFQQSLPPETIVCPHTQEEAFNLMRMAVSIAGNGAWELVGAAIAESRSQVHGKADGKDQREGSRDIKEATSKWHHYPRLMKCEYCATDAKFFIRKALDSPIKDCFEYRFEVYHDFGSLYQTMTLPQRQLIEVATNLPKVQVIYPSTLEFHERLLEDLEQRFHEPVPLNIRGTAMNTMQQMTHERRQAILNISLPKQVSLFSPWGRTWGQRSPGFNEMVRKCGEPAPCSCPAAIWFEQQMTSNLAWGLKSVSGGGPAEM